MTNPLAAPKVRALPESQQARLWQIRDQMLRDASEAIRRYAGPLRRKADRLMSAVWEARDNPRRVRHLIGSFYSAEYRELATVVTDQIMDAVLYAQRYEEQLIDYKVRMRHRLKDRPAAGEVKAISDYSAYFRLNYGKPGALAAIAYAARQAETEAEKAGLRSEFMRARRQRLVRRQREVEKRLARLERHGRDVKLVTEGDKLARKHLRPFQGTAGLSTKLHGEAVANSREASRVVLRAIRESNSVSWSARELQRNLRKQGQKFAQGDRYPQLVQELLESGGQLARRAGDPATLERWLEVQWKLQQYQLTLAEGGTVQNAYLELLQEVSSPQFQARHVKQAVDRWAYYKQRYRAETFIKTEQATAYRLEALAAQRRQPWIVGYRWELNSPSHRRFKRRRKGRGLKKFGGKACICEVMAGKTLSPSVAEEYPNGGHPHCQCALIPVYNHEMMMDAEITGDEESWWSEQMGERQ